MCVCVCVCMCVSVCVYVCVSVCVCVCVYIYKIGNDGDHSRGRLKGFLFNSIYIKVWRRALLLFLDCTTLPLIRTL